MRKLISLILILSLLFALAACGADDPGEPVTHDDAAPEPTEEIEPGGDGADGAEPQEQEPAEPVGLPAVGDVVEGFKVLELREFPLVGATVVRFEHEKTGAELYYIANNDVDRVFDLTFFTRAIDNTGLPHVFEHSTLDGSEKYPSKALFFNLSYQTYNTYMNALTYPLLTTYPVASLSEAQLLKYADYYTDSCLHPLIMEDESIFREEAWRYRLADKNDDLTIEGTVYSEMQGAMDLSSSAYTNMLRAAFPGSTIGNVSGGEPASIPDMTWESLRSYHDLYYHPSNCVAYLYGQFNDYTAFLRLLDEAFAPYERREFDFDDSGWTPIEGDVTESVAFPVEQTSDVNNASTVYYAILCPGLNQDPEEEMILNTLTDLLIVDASPLMQSLKRALPNGNFATFIEMDGPEDLILFYAENVNPEDAQTFRDTVDAVLKTVAENGFDEELVDGVMASLALSTSLIGEGDNVGVNLVTSIAASYAPTGEPYSYMDYVDALGKIGEWNGQGLYAKAVSDWLLGSGNAILCTTYPQAGLREELDEAEAQRLAEVKAAMSDEEIQAIIDMTNAPDDEEDASEYVAQLQAVTVASLPEEIRMYDVDDVTEDGVRYLNVEADVDGVGSAALLLDASGLAQEDIHWFALFNVLAGELDTASHTREELAVLMTRYFYDGEIRLSIAEDENANGFTPRLRAGWKATDEDLAAGYDLMYEVLFETDYSDVETLSGVVDQAASSLKSSITSEPYSTMLYRALGYYNPLYRYYSYFNGIEFYTFLTEVQTALEEDPAAVQAKLESVRDYFRNRAGAAAVYVGSADGIAVNAPLARAFMGKLENAPVTVVYYDLPAPAQREALIIDSTVQYNGMVADFDTVGLVGYTGDQDAASALLSDGYLYPMLRDQYGAYGVFAGSVMDGGVYAISYRDPNVTETFEVYEGMADYFRDLEITQEELDGYILSSYSYYAAPDGELAGGMNAAMDTLTGDSQEDTLGYMRDLKAVTPEALQAYADVYEALAADGVRFTAGGAGAVNANADLFDEILNPFGAKDTSEVELEDVPEDHQYYEGVRFVYENILMLPAEETRFGVDDEATVGDLMGALYALIGGDASVPDEAIEYLSQFGIIAAGTSSSKALTGSEAETILKNFGQAAEAPYRSSGSVPQRVLTRGELADLILTYYDSIV